MTDQLWKSIDEYTKERQMLAQGDHILVAFSGGADSVCLMRYLLYKKEKMDLCLTAVHLNHMIRGPEADRDENFVREFCLEHGLQLVSESRNVKEYAKSHRCSEEEAGRLLRYRLFEETARRLACNKIAIAHNRDDQAETLLFRMARGTGLHGMGGIRPVSGAYIRPLLHTGKKEIFALLDTLGQPYVEDSSNRSTDYRRNYVRHRILPELREVNEQAAVHISELADKLSETWDYLDGKLGRLYKEKIGLLPDGTLFFRKTSYEGLAPYEQGEMLRHMLFQAAGREKDIRAVHIDQLQELMEGPSGRRVSLPYGLTAVREPEGLRLGKTLEVAADGEKEAGFSLDLPGLPEMNGDPLVLAIPERDVTFSFRTLPNKEPDFFKNNCSRYFDYDNIKGRLCIRTRQPGDYFVMDGQGRHKSLRRFFIDEKIPADRRDRILLLAEGSHILWVVGYRISEAYKISDSTIRVFTADILGGEKNGRQNQCNDPGIGSRC